MPRDNDEDLTPLVFPERVSQAVHGSPGCRCTGLAGRFHWFTVTRESPTIVWSPMIGLSWRDERERAFSVDDEEVVGPTGCDTGIGLSRRRNSARS